MLFVLLYWSSVHYKMCFIPNLFVSSRLIMFLYTWYANGVNNIFFFNKLFTVDWHWIMREKEFWMLPLLYFHFMAQLLVLMSSFDCCFIYDYSIIHVIWKVSFHHHFVWYIILKNKIYDLLPYISINIYAFWFLNLLLYSKFYEHCFVITYENESSFETFRFLAYHYTMFMKKKAN